MKTHILKAQENETFLSFIESNSKESFLDWRITVIFYSALHYLRAFLVKNNIKAGHSHNDLDAAINHSHPLCKCPMPRPEYLAYKELYKLSRSARYEALVYSTSFQLQLKKIEVQTAKRLLADLKAYFKENGLTID